MQGSVEALTHSLSPVLAKCHKGPGAALQKRLPIEFIIFTLYRMLKESYIKHIGMQGHLIGMDFFGVR